MLICNISARPQRIAILADIVEPLFASEVSIVGNVFTALIDEPASITEWIDAFTGEIMNEAASASDVVTIGTIYNAAILEDGPFATEVMRDPQTITDSVIETANADSAQNTALASATFDGVNTNVTMSNGNLTVTHNISAIGGARSTMLKNSGKWYFEITKTSQSTPYPSLGILTAAGTYTNMVTDWTNSLSDRAFLNPNYDSVIGPSGSSPGKNLSGTTAPTLPETIGVAVDLDNWQVWFRVAPSGNWNGDAAANPATNTGGVSISALSATTVSPAVGFGVTITDVFTMNAGASAFIGTVPSGFNAGWY